MTLQPNQPLSGPPTSSEIKRDTTPPTVDFSVELAECWGTEIHMKASRALEWRSRGAQWLYDFFNCFTLDPSDRREAYRFYRQSTDTLRPLFEDSARLLERFCAYFRDAPPVPEGCVTTSNIVDLATHYQLNLQPLLKELVGIADRAALEIPKFQQAVTLDLGEKFGAESFLTSCSSDEENNLRASLLSFAQRVRSDSRLEGIEDPKKTLNLVLIESVLATPNAQALMVDISESSHELPCSSQKLHACVTTLLDAISHASIEYRSQLKRELDWSTIYNFARLSPESVDTVRSFLLLFWAPLYTVEASDSFNVVFQVPFLALPPQEFPSHPLVNLRTGIGGIVTALSPAFGELGGTLHSSVIPAGGNAATYDLFEIKISFDSLRTTSLLNPGTEQQTLFPQGLVSHPLDPFDALSKQTAAFERWRDICGVPRTTAHGNRYTLRLELPITEITLLLSDATALGKIDAIIDAHLGFDTVTIFKCSVKEADTANEDEEREFGDEPHSTPSLTPSEIGVSFEKLDSLICRINSASVASLENFATSFRAATARPWEQVLKEDEDEVDPEVSEYVLTDLELLLNPRSHKLICELCSSFNIWVLDLNRFPSEGEPSSLKEARLFLKRLHSFITSSPDAVVITSNSFLRLAARLGGTLGEGEEALYTTGTIEVSDANGLLWFHGIEQQEAGTFKLTTTEEERATTAAVADKVCSALNAALHRTSQSHISFTFESFQQELTAVYLTLPYDLRHQLYEKFRDFDFHVHRTVPSHEVYQVVWDFLTNIPFTLSENDGLVISTQREAPNQLRRDA